MDKTKNIIGKIVIFILAVGVLCLLLFFLKDIVFPFIKLEVENDIEGAKQLLLEKGALGYITVSIIEALQMVVIFIPAEFIQLSSGMSYPWYVAIIFCDIGVIVGSSIIYFIVNVIKFNPNLEKSNSKIRKYEKKIKTNNTIILMYILFIMPIIPFGAICYWSSNRKLPYHRYVLTCATGAIPSILTSILMGTAVKEFIRNEIPIWLLILIIVLAASILFVLLAFVLNRYVFKNSKGTPHALWVEVGVGIARFIASLFGPVKVAPNKVHEIDGPYILLANHHNPLDFHYAFSIDPETTFYVVVNKWYFSRGLLGKGFQKSGFIPKKLFDNDIHAVKEIIRVAKGGNSILMFPEARLSTDGGPSTINMGTASLVKKIGFPVVIAQLRGYLVKPKWRKKYYRHPVEVEVSRIISPEELSSFTKEEIHTAITEALNFNEFDREIENYKGRKKAEGLENILYLCPHCRSLYSNVSKGNNLKCLSCGKEYNINNHYSFDNEEIKNIYEYYQKIKEIELEDIDNIDFNVPVTAKIYTGYKSKPRTKEGTFLFNKDGVEFLNEEGGKVFSYTIYELEGIAYSVNEEFEMYYKDELYYFYPKEDRRICTRIALIYELLRGRLNEK